MCGQTLETLGLDLPSFVIRMTIAAKRQSSYDRRVVNQRLKTHLAACAVVLLAAPILAAVTAQPTADQNQFFENKVRPILANNCYKCHSSQAQKLKGGLSLEFKDSTAQRRRNGPAVVPGEPEKSLLIKAVRYTDPDLQMPPKGKKLSDADIDTLVTWVRMGAPDPRVVTGDAKFGPKIRATIGRFNRSNVTRCRRCRIQIGS